MEYTILHLALLLSTVLFTIVFVYFTIALPFMLTVDPAIDPKSKIGKFIHGLILTVKYSWYMFVCIWIVVVINYLFALGNITKAYFNF